MEPPESTEEQLARGPAKSGCSRHQRIGLEIAEEEQAVAFGKSALDITIQRETETLIKKSTPLEQAEVTIEKLPRGEITDDKAPELAEVCGAQVQDRRSDRIRQRR